MRQPLTFGDALAYHRSGDALRLMRWGRFSILLCPTWHPGWQYAPGVGAPWSLLVMLIPGLAFGWRGKWPSE